MQPGQTNSWIDSMTIKNSPCIGETINMSGTSLEPIPEEEQAKCNYLWWIIGAFTVGYLFKSGRQ